jgi:hypothetical protein
MRLRIFLRTFPASFGVQAMLFETALGLWCEQHCKMPVNQMVPK